MKEVKVASYKEVGLNYGICEEVYEEVCGKEIEGRFLDVELLKIILENTFSELDKLKGYDDEVLIEF